MSVPNSREFLEIVGAPALLSGASTDYLFGRVDAVDWSTQSVQIDLFDTGASDPWFPCYTPRMPLLFERVLLKKIGSEWIVVGISPRLTHVATSNVNTVNNTTALTAVQGMHDQIALLQKLSPTAYAWSFKASIPYTASTTAGLKLFFDFPFSPTFRCSSLLYDSSYTGGAQLRHHHLWTTETMTFPSTTGASMHLLLRGSVYWYGEVGTFDKMLGVKYAQVTAHASDLTLGVGSSLEVQPIQPSDATTY